ncbi:polysaccharide biosynthesis tyrosine autokinase [Gallaecimonas kandeliae]|nr:polysaccharide biosynthesis tyrosine autokinase [Gallaecimonas kandeliae]WKE67451.1 polysaccharide biosynthesis tyrosine autokinase [Gallaecimonas kandeliae]
MSRPAVSRIEDDEIDLRQLWGAILEGKWSIAACTALALLVGLAVALFSPPVYQADALLQVEEKNGGMSSLLEMSDIFAQEASTSAEVEIIKSRLVLGGAVDDLGLDLVVSPHYFPIVGQYLARHHQGGPDGSHWFGSYAWGGEQINVARLAVPAEFMGQPLTLTALPLQGYRLSFDGDTLLEGKVGELAEVAGISLMVTDLKARPGTTFDVLKKERLQAITDLAARLSVSERGQKTGILQASMTGSDKARLKAALDAVGNHYLLQNLKRNAAQAEGSLDFLKRQLPEIKSKLDKAEDKLNDYRLKTRSVDLGLETQGILKQTVEVENQLNELKFKEAELSRLYTQSHPAYKALMEQIQTLKQDKARLGSQIKALPKTQQEVLRLTRDVEVNQQIYLTLLNKVQELKVLKAGTVGNVRILDKAAVQPQPVKPKQSLVVVLATLLGAMLGTMIVLVRSFMRRGIESPEQLEEVGINVYASIPQSETQRKLEDRIKKRHRKGDREKHPLLAEENPADLAIEALRGLRTSLHFAMMEAKNNVLMISGPSPSVGKSFVSANLAAVSTQSGQKVLLIDADMRRGYMHALFQASNNKGLSALLSGQCQSDEAILPTAIEGLDLLPRGMAPPNPSELLMHPNFKALLDWAQGNYDLIIVDTPPILAVTDPALVGRLAGTSLLVARYGQNPVKEVEVTLRRFEQNGIDIKGVILNGMVRKAAQGYGAYGYYSYDYQPAKS